MQMACMYSVVSARSSGNFIPETATDLTLESALCVVRKSRPGTNKTVAVLFLDPISSMFTHLHFYRRELEVENT